MRVLICGGRKLDLSKVADWLEEWTPPRPVSLVIYGDANGADMGGQLWAVREHIEMLCFFANWEKYGRAAGPIRNKQMLEEGKPDLVIAFPGGKGTGNMVKQAIDAGVEVQLIDGDFF